MKPIPISPALPSAGRAQDTRALSGFDADLNKALYNILSDMAARINALLPKDGSEPMSGDLNMGGNNIDNVLTIRLTSTADASLTSTGHAFQIGPTTGTNLIIDNNEIVVRNNGVAQTMGLQGDGGTLNVGKLNDTGNLNLLCGGIAFPATQNPSTGVNVLDDYEEGTWTPTLAYATPGDSVFAYSTNAGSYIKIGKLVRLSFAIVTTTHTFTTAAGSLTIAGLPFAAGGGVESVGSMQYNGILLSAGRTQTELGLTNGSQALRMVQSPTRFVVVATTNTTSGTQIQIAGSIVYEASA